MLKTFFDLIDLFGMPVTINFSGREKFKSRLSGICSLLFFGFLAWSIYNGSRDLFSRENPRIITSQNFQEEPREMTLSLQNFPISAGVNAPDALGIVPFRNESIYKIEMTHFRLVRTQLADGSFEEVVTETPLVTETCTPAHFGELAPSFTTFYLDNTYCVAANQPVGPVTIRGGYSNPIWEIVIVKLIRCGGYESTEPCAPDDVIEEWLDGCWFNLFNVNMAVDPKNFTRPDARYRDVYGTMVATGSYKDSEIELGYVSVTTDAGWIVASDETEEYVKVERIREYVQLKPNSENVLLQAVIQVSMLESNYVRSYKKIQDLLAEVGGLTNAVFIIILILINPYMRLKFRQSLINELFDVHTSEKELESHSSKIQDRDSNFSKNLLKKSPFSQDSPKAKDHLDFSEKYLAIYGQKIEGLELNQLSSLEPGSPTTPHSPSVLELNSRKKEKTAYFGGGESQIRIPSFLKVIDARTNSILDDRMSVKTLLKDNSGQPTQNNSLKLKDGTGESTLKVRIGESPSRIREMIADEQDQPGDHSFISSMELVLERTITSAKNIPDQKNEVEKQVKNENKEPEKENQEGGGEEERTPGTSTVPSLFVSKRPWKKIVEKTAEPNIVESRINPPQRISLTCWELLCQFFYKSKLLKVKKDILEEGMKNIDARLDVINILKKLREVDKMKAILLDPDQHVLFNNLPKPEIRPRGIAKEGSGAQISFSHGLLKNSAFIEQNASDMHLIEAYKRLKNKPKKTKIDERLISVFKDKVS